MSDNQTKKILNSDSGIALFLTIAIITLLVAVTLELHRKARAAVVSGAMARDGITSRHMASSGINAAMALLAKDKKESETDSIQEVWADKEAMSRLAGDLIFKNGSLTIQIEDELGKIQVNSLMRFPEGRLPQNGQMFLLDRFLTLFYSEEDQSDDIKPRQIVNSLRDWLDSGDDEAITGLNGAESGYYLDLDTPYPCRNGPVDHINELAFVKGITHGLLYGDKKLSGISNFITIYGMTDSGAFEGKININTADVPVLMAILPDGYENLAQEINDYRSETSDTGFINDLTNPAWYKNVPGCSDITIDPKLISVSSDFFRIKSTAKLRAIKSKITAIVKREKNSKTGKFKCRIISWEKD